MTLTFHNYKYPEDYQRVSDFLIANHHPGNLDGNWLEPAYRHLREEMLDYAEANLAGVSQKDGRKYLCAYVNDNDPEFLTLIQARGHQKDADATLVIQALDLGIIVPVSVVTAVLLWQKKPWGYTLASVLLVKALMMGVALVAMMVGQALAGVELGVVESVIFTGISLTAIAVSMLLFRNIKPSEKRG
jgi:hypothetical protein